MSDSNVNLVRSVYDAFATRNQAAMLAMFDPQIDIHLSEVLPWGGQYKGFVGLQVFFGRLLWNLDWSVEPRQFLDAGDAVVVVGQTRGRTRTSGRPFDIPVVHIWRVRGGKIVSFEAFTDAPSMLKALEK
jgi:hypothetical protein